MPFSRLLLVAALVQGGPCDSQSALRPEPLAESAMLELGEAVLELPWPLDRQQLLVPVSVAGEGPFWFALDTGSEARAVVDPFLVDRLRLAAVGGALSNDASGRRAWHRKRRLPSLRVGSPEGSGLDLGDVDALVGDLGFLGDGIEVHGVLGLRLFTDHTVQVDGPAGMIRWFSTPLDPEAPGIERWQGREVPWLPIQVGEHRGWALLDTGFDGAIGLPGDWRKVCETMAPPRVTGRLQSLHASGGRIWSGRLEGDLVVLGHRFRQPPVQFLEGHRQALIGAKALRPFVLSLRPSSRRLHLWLPDVGS